MMRRGNKAHVYAEGRVYGGGVRLQCRLQLEGKPMGWDMSFHGAQRDLGREGRWCRQEGVFGTRTMFSNCL